MSNSLAWVIALFGVALLVAVVTMLPGGCKGNCEQGRKPCDCEENNG